MSGLGDHPEGVTDPDSRLGSSRRAGWVVLAFASLAFPVPVAFFFGLGLIAVTGDPAVTLGISEDLLNVLLVGVTGLLAGTVVGLIDQRWGASLLVPASAGLVVGPVIYAAFLAFSTDESDFSNIQLVIWLGISVAIFVTTQTSGYAMVGSVAAVGLVGMGAAAFIQSQPEPPVGVVVVVEDYSVDESSGECSGDGEASEVAAGNIMVFVDQRTAEEVASVVLEAGSVAGSGCRFDLGDPLGLEAAEYAEFISVDPESGELAVGGSSSFEGNTVVHRIENG